MNNGVNGAEGQGAQPGRPDQHTQAFPAPHSNASWDGVNPSAHPNGPQPGSPGSQYSQAAAGSASQQGQHPGQFSPQGAPQQPGSLGQPGHLGQSNTLGQPNPQAGLAGGYGAGSSFGGPQSAVKAPKRWSTSALAAMLLAGAVAASATTAVVMDQTGAVGSGNHSTSFDTSNSSNNESVTDPVTPGSTEDIASRVLPSVVSIQVKTARGGGEGSGSIFSSDGMIVTNNHVVAGAENGGIQVRLNDGRILQAKLVAADAQTDIAVIKAEGANDLQPIQLGDSNTLNVGESVIAIGSPLGLTSTVTTGIVSAKNRPVQAGGESGGEASLIDAIQTDAAINPGNSGGALVDQEGKLVGIPSVIATMGGTGTEQSGSIGLGFAIPVNQAKQIAQDLIEKGKTEHPIIGAKINTGSSVYGAEIAGVNDGSPADEAGLKEGDVVTRVDDRPVESGVGLIAAIRSHQVGDQVKLTVTNSNGRDERTVNVTLSAE